MALTPKLALRQSQSLVMTPQLMQAIKLLQLSSLDLVAYVEKELEQNPLLERQEPAAPEPREAAAEAEVGEGDWSEPAPGSRAEVEARLDTDYGNVFPDDAPQSPERPATGPASGSEARPRARARTSRPMWRTAPRSRTISSGSSRWRCRAPPTG